MQLRFLSTLSLRRATCYIIFAQAVTNISIHALLAESDNVACGYWHKLRNFYPRSPCGERPTPRCRPLSRAPFLSTLSLRRATVQNYNACVGARISIHALLAESDQAGYRGRTERPHFYPRSPCGERPKWFRVRRYPANFYPRSPCGERPHSVGPWQAVYTDFYPRSPCGERLISIVLSIQPIKFLSTLSLRRATFASAGRLQIVNNFYPRSPCGERLWWG